MDRYRLALSAVGLAAIVACGIGEEVRLGRPTSFPSAGISLAFPAGDKPRIPRRPGGLWATANKARGGTALHAVPYPDGMTPPSSRAWAEKIARTPGVKSDNVLASGTVAVGVGVGWRIVARSDSPTGGGINIYTVWAKRYKTKKLTLCFTLAVLSPGPDVDSAKAVADAVIRSVRYIPIRSPGQGDLPPLVHQMDLRQHGFRMRLPVGWFLLMHTIRNKSVKLNAGVIDSGSARLGATVNVSVGPLSAGPDVTSKEHITAYVAYLGRTLVGTTVALLSAQTTKVSGVVSAELVLQLETKGQKVLQVQRIFACNRRFHAITLTWPSGNRKTAKAAMAKLAGAFEIMDGVASRPTGEPTSEPLLHLP